jgi:hypothetical protein
MESAFPNWAFWALLGMDAALLILAVCVVLGPSPSGRIALGGVMVMLGGGLLCVAIQLRGTFQIPRFRVRIPEVFLRKKKETTQRGNVFAGVDPTKVEPQAGESPESIRQKESVEPSKPMSDGKSRLRIQFLEEKPPLRR